MQNHTFTNTSPISERLLALIAEGVGQFEQKEDIVNCKKCVLADTRKRVVVAQKILPKKFFILSEFPETGDESSNAVFSTDSNSNIILNLIDKLGIQNDCHHAFALKCVPHKYIPDDNLSVCVYENLRLELSKVRPQVIFCFGPRAFLALNKVELHKTELYVLPTAQELKQFPHWRLPVWSKLLHFKIKKED